MTNIYQEKDRGLFMGIIRFYIKHQTPDVVRFPGLIVIINGNIFM